MRMESCWEDVLLVYPGLRGLIAAPQEVDWWRDGDEFLGMSEVEGTDIYIRADGKAFFEELEWRSDDGEPLLDAEGELPTNIVQTFYPA